VRNFLKGIRLRWQCNEELLGFKTQERDARFRLFRADFEKIGENWIPEKRWVKNVGVLRRLFSNDNRTDVFGLFFPKTTRYTAPFLGNGLGKAVMFVLL
jgi:hypothetical protein